MVPLCVTDYPSFQPKKFIAKCHLANSRNDALTLKFPFHCQSSWALQNLLIPKLISVDDKIYISYLLRNFSNGTFPAKFGEWLQKRQKVSFRSHLSCIYAAKSINFRLTYSDWSVTFVLTLEISCFLGTGLPHTDEGHKHTSKPRLIN